MTLPFPSHTSRCYYRNMLALLLRWIISTITLLLVARVLDGFEFTSFYSALITALILGFVNALIRPILVLLTLPITLITFGLFLFVVNALMLWFVASIVKGFSIDTFQTALIAALIIWAINFIADWLTSRLETKHPYSA